MSHRKQQNVKTIFERLHLVLCNNQRAHILLLDIKQESIAHYFIAVFQSNRGDLGSKDQFLLKCFYQMRKANGHICMCQEYPFCLFLWIFSWILEPFRQCDTRCIFCCFSFYFLILHFKCFFFIYPYSNCVLVELVLLNIYFSEQCFVDQICLFILTIVLSFLLRSTASDYLFGIFKFWQCKAPNI